MVQENTIHSKELNSVIELEDLSKDSVAVEPNRSQELQDEKAVESSQSHMVSDSLAQETPSLPVSIDQSSPTVPPKSFTVIDGTTIFDNDLPTPSPTYNHKVLNTRTKTVLIGVNLTADSIDAQQSQPVESISDVTPPMESTVLFDDRGTSQLGTNSQQDSPAQMQSDDVLQSLNETNSSLSDSAIANSSDIDDEKTASVVKSTESLKLDQPKSESVVEESGKNILNNLTSMHFAKNETNFEKSAENVPEKNEKIEQNESVIDENDNQIVDTKLSASVEDQDSSENSMESENEPIDVINDSEDKSIESDVPLDSNQLPDELHPNVLQSSTKVEDSVFDAPPEATDKPKVDPSLSQNVRSDTKLEDPIKVEKVESTTSPPAPRDAFASIHANMHHHGHVHAHHADNHPDHLHDHSSTSAPAVNVESSSLPPPVRAHPDSEPRVRIRSTVPNDRIHSSGGQVHSAIPQHITSSTPSPNDASPESTAQPQQSVPIISGVGQGTFKAINSFSTASPPIVDPSLHESQIDSDVYVAKPTTSKESDERNNNKSGARRRLLADRSGFVSVLHEIIPDEVELFFENFNLSLHAVVFTAIIAFNWCLMKVFIIFMKSSKLGSELKGRSVLSVPFQTNFSLLSSDLNNQAHRKIFFFEAEKEKLLSEINSIKNKVS